MNKEKAHLLLEPARDSICPGTCVCVIKLLNSRGLDLLPLYSNVQQQDMVLYFSKTKKYNLIFHPIIRDTLSGGQPGKQTVLRFNRLTWFEAIV